MGIVRKLKDGARWIENGVEIEAPRPQPTGETAEDVDQVAQLLTAWCADVEADPFPANTSAPEATR